MWALGLLTLFSLGCSRGEGPPSPPDLGTASSADTIFNGSGTPGTADVDSGDDHEVGVRVFSDVGGNVTGLRFYKGAANTGAHTGHLWATDGTLLSTVAFSGESASGWQDMALPSSISIEPNVTYIASYHTTTGFSFDASGFGAQVDAPPLHVPEDGGVYAFGSDPSFPSSTYGGANYWVDVDFTQGGPCACTACGVDDGCGNLCCGSSAYSVWQPTDGPSTPGTTGSFNFELGTQIVPSINGTITDLRYYRDAADTGTHPGNLWDSTGKLLASVTFSGTTAGWQDQALSPPVAVTAGQT